ncbi:sodium:solute symporter family protein [Paraburkholderia sp. SARCC-3016]|nr:sodium:solute symporter family protein [Paraburkholderia sp. SARCC-3016]MDQ7978288.1 sodium:solute symporter family protein [Paraburkholderia sp. SARCC-3016]
MNLEEWSIGGRGFSAPLVFVLMAGEIYTTFTLLGASGFAYGYGGASLYIIVYTTQAFVLSYWLLPAIWRFAKENELLTQADFFARKYDSTPLGLLVACISLTALLPYLILQFKGLGILVSATSYGSISSKIAIWVGAAVMGVYVMAAGMHGSAVTAVVKDVLVLSVCVFLGVYLPIHYYGNLPGMFSAIDAAKPGFLSLSAHGKNLTWYVSTITVCGLGMFMWPHTFSSVFTAKSDDHFRRNASVMPLYALVMLFSMFVGMAAVLRIPPLKGGQIDLALLRLSIATFNPWEVGVIGAAGLLTALVPGSIMLVSVATLFTQNVYRPLAPRATDERLARVAKFAAAAFTLLSAAIALYDVQSIVALLIMGYNLVTQVLPALLASLLTNNPVNRLGAAVGMTTGLAAVLTMYWTGGMFAGLFPSQSWIADINPGLVALLLNVATMVAVSTLTAHKVIDVRT